MVICYIIVAIGLKKASPDTIKHWMIKPSYLMWYPASQLVLYIPFIIAGFCVLFKKPPSDGLDLSWRACLHLAGFVNSIVFLKMRRDLKKMRTQTRSDQDSLLLPVSQAPHQGSHHNKNFTVNELCKSS